MSTATIETSRTLKQLSRKVRIICQDGAKMDWNAQDEWQQKATGWHCTLRFQGRQYSFDFWQGPAITGEPTAEGCLECLLSDAQSGEQDFESFCGEFGYDQDSRKAEKTWQACQKTTAGLKRLLGDDYEAFLYADRN